MRISLPYLLTSILLFFCFCDVSLALSTNYIDTTFDPIPGAKVMIANGDDALEITPLNITDSSVLIEPINRNTNKGISTRFFLSDSSFWSFYTNSNVRLTINGNGNIVTHAPLLVNDANPDSLSVLRVNGRATFDSSIYIKGDTSTFFSISNRVKSVYTDPDDNISPYTYTPITWANGKDIPVFRLRHPKNVANLLNDHVSTARDFMILPYQYGTAIEFNGVVECWVGEWSIHKGLGYVDVEGKGNGWGGISWVGDDVDGGGVRMTARNNHLFGGNVRYGEISVERFTGEANGDLRLRLPSAENTFQFIYGERGSNNIVAKISDKGFFIPMIPSIDSITAPEKSQLSFDSSDNQLKLYNGTQWKTISNTDTNTLVTGTAIFTSDGTSMVYSIPHGLSSTPSYFNVIPTSADAANISYITADATSIIVHYLAPPIIGIDNLSWNWQIKK